MSRFVDFILLSLFSLSAYIFSISPLTDFSVQLIALTSTAAVVSYRRANHFFTFFTAFSINLLLFVTGGLESRFFFFAYFLLFYIAFQHPPTVTFGYSLVLILLLSYSLNSLSSVVVLLSLLLITPLVWFVGFQYLENLSARKIIATDETDLLLWFSLRFKSSMASIIDSTSQLLSHPLTPTQKTEVKLIKHTAKELLKSADQLQQEIDRNSDET